MLWSSPHPWLRCAVVFHILLCSLHVTLLSLLFVEVLWSGWDCWTLLGYPQDKGIFWYTLFVPKPLCVKKKLVRSQNVAGISS